MGAVGGGGKEERVEGDGALAETEVRAKGEMGLSTHEDIGSTAQAILILSDPAFYLTCFPGTLSA